MPPVQNNYEDDPYTDRTLIKPFIPFKLRSRANDDSLTKESKTENIPQDSL